MLKNGIRLFVIALLLVIGGSVWGQIPSNAVKTVVNGREFYRYTVEKGIGLYRISVNFGVTQEEIIKENPSVAQGLHEGDVLLIPVVGSNKPVTVGANSHVVEKGQTLYSIANQYGVTVEALLEKNPFLQDGLKEGTVIQIPTTLESAKKVESDKPAIKGFEIHVVQPKETLFGIAKQYGITVDRLVELNPGVREEGLKIGAALKIVPNKEVLEAVSVSQQPEWNEADFSLVHFYKLAVGDNVHSLARKFGVPYADLVKANLGVDLDNAEVGTVLMVPVNPLTNNDLLRTEWYQTYKIGKKETLYAISKKHDLSEALVKLFNPTLNLSDLKKGQTLNLPTKEWVMAFKATSARKKEEAMERDYVVVSNNCNDYNYFQSREVLKVAVLLPFNVSLNSLAMMADTTSTQTGTSSEGADIRTLGGHTKMILEFYEGFLMGVDKWKRQGVNIQLMAFDTGSESADIQKVLAKPDLERADIIVGPAYPDHVKAVSDYSRQHKIKMVSPFSASSSEVKNNPHFFLASPVDSAAVVPMAQCIVNKAKNANLIVVRSVSGSDSETRMIQILKGLYLQNGGSNFGQFKEVVFAKESLSSIMAVMSRETNNVVVVPSANEVFVGQVVIAMDAIAEKNVYPMEVYGLPEWLKFQTLDPESLHRFNCRIFSSYGFDYDNAETKLFIQDFRMLYNSEPVAFSPYFQRVSVGSGYNRYGAWGHDVAYYFLGCMVNYGRSFETCVSNMSNKGLIQTNFKFNRVSNWGGFYSSGLFLIEFNNDFSVVRRSL